MMANRYFARIPAIIAVLALLAMGCEEDLASVGIGNDPSMNATVDGKTWSAANNVQGTILSSLKSITGAAGDGSSININLTNVFEPAALDFDGGKFTACYTLGAEDFDATSGDVVVTSLEGNNISGTFNFRGENGSGDVVVVESGTFQTTLR